MNRWTGVFAPQRQEDSSVIRLKEIHFWGLCGIVCLLAFLLAFFFQREREFSQRTELLGRANQRLQQENSERATSTPAVSSETVAGRDAVRQAEARLRAEYEASIATITAELGDLYDMEKRARNITGLQPRKAARLDSGNVGLDGKGGGPSSMGPSEHVGEKLTLNPPHLIYGSARPSADLIIEEIRLRTASLSELVRDMEVQKERIERVPAGWPLARGVGRISSGFGYRRDPFSRRVRHHDGVDISARHGTAVRATARGRVVKAEYMNYYGNMVIIDHGDGISTGYAHLSAMNVRPGATVGRGDVIGAVGSTGKSTGAHLHYEVRVKGRQVNPAKYLVD
jgi:murein DD-endopeptidase MepM/ murein hydrolase activator NlpD